MNISNNSNSLQTVKLNNKAVFHVTQEFKNKVRYLCDKIPDKEWSGPLFINVEGDIDSPEGVKITPVDIFPLDIGSHGSTEYDFDEQIFDYYDQYPNRFGMKYAHLHSHSNMNTFFSGTDLQELYDNVGNHNFYVSIVVNNMGSIIGKLVIKGKQKITSTSNYSLSGILGKIISMNKSEDKEIDVMYCADLTIEGEKFTEEDTFFISNVNKLIEKNKNTFSSNQSKNKSNFPYSEYNKDNKPVIYNQNNSKEEDIDYLLLLKYILTNGAINAQTLSVKQSLEFQKMAHDDYIFDIFDSENVVDYLRDISRFGNTSMFVEPSVDELTKIYNRFRILLSPYVFGEYSKIVDVINTAIDMQLELAQELSTENETIRNEIHRESQNWWEANKNFKSWEEM